MASASAAMLPGLSFDFWNDKEYQGYGPDEQRLLQAKLAESPWPAEVLFPNGKYVVRHFQAILEGKSVQVNLATGYERRIRIRPPYQVPGHAAFALPPGGAHFQFQDDGCWRPYGARLQQELLDAAVCAPPPHQVFFGESRNAYCLMGLQTLVGGGPPRLVQVNLRSGMERSVQLVPGPVVAGAAPVPGPARAPGPAFSWSSVSFEVSRGPGRPERVAPDARDVLVAAWKQEPRPDQVRLPSGDLVERFGALEVGGAIAQPRSPAGAIQRGLSLIRRPSRPAPLILRALVPLATCGVVVLPDELQGDGGFSLSSCGRYLSPQQVLHLASQGSQATSCSVCMCDMVPDGQAAATGAANPNPDMAMHLDLGATRTEVFQLQCGHAYHTDCLEQWFVQRRRCPQCAKDFGIVIGNQPKDGRMEWDTEPFSLPGHPDAPGTIVLWFRFPPGADADGKRFEGRNTKCYLPNNVQGVLLLELFKVAFRRRVMFGLGESHTLGAYRPTINIHIKTSTHRGTTGHGYPDDDYFKRSLEELRTNGVTMDDLPP